MEYDYVVVGGGSAGCVTAARLVGKYGARVLLLEGGYRGRSPLVRIPAGFVRMLYPPGRYLRAYDSERQAQLDGRSVRVLQANVLGGGSAVNAMTYTRGARADYDAWDAYLGGQGWGWNDLLPTFIEQEGNQRLGAPHHGTDGPLKVSDPHHPPSEISRAFLLAVQALGIPYTSDINAGDVAGATYIQSTTYRGERFSAARAFVEPLAGNPRLTVLTRARATRVIFEDHRAAGVEFAANGGRGLTVVRARHEVVLTAGCFATAQLLMLSGIGPARMLREHDIDVRSDLPGVGQNLQDHNDARLAVGTRGNFGYADEDRGLRLLKNGLQYALFRSGPAASTGSEVTAFINPLDRAGTPTIQFYCLGKIARLPSDTAEPPPGATLVANLIAPRSRGSLRLRSADPADLPAINPNWLSEPEDMRALVAGVRFLFDIIRTPPFAGKVDRILRPAGESLSDQVLADYCRRVTSTNWHPVGSCRMGPDRDPMAVLDARLRVRGVRGLRVFDASMMPTIISANTNAPVMAIAQRGVDLMMRPTIEAV